MPTKVSFQCPYCTARIKAPRQIIGQSRSCPGCGFSIIVRDAAAHDASQTPTLPDAAPMLATDEFADLMGDSGESFFDQARRIEELEAENARLRKLVAKLGRAAGPQ